MMLSLARLLLCYCHWSSAGCGVFATAVAILAAGSGSAQEIKIRCELDDDSVKGFAPDLSRGEFSVVVRASLLSEGTRRGNSDGLGMVVSCGSGWHDGFRIVYDWKSFSLALQVGRALEKSCIEVRSSNPVYPGVMHEIACVYDGARLRLFIDGCLSNECPYSGAIDATGASLNIGYTGFGVGSNRMFVDTLQFFPSAMTPREVADHFDQLPEPDRKTLEALSEFMPSRRAINLTISDKALQILVHVDTLPPSIREDIRTAYWQRMCADGHFELAVPLVQDAAHRLLNEAARNDSSVRSFPVRNRVTEEVIALRAAMARMPPSPEMTSVSAELESTFRDELAFRSPLGRAGRNAADRVRSLETEALADFDRAYQQPRRECRIIHVARSGADRNPGTSTMPVKSLSQAVDMAARIRNRAPENTEIVIDIAAGDYQCEGTTVIRGLSGLRIRGATPAGGGRNSSNSKARPLANDARTRLTGGIRLSNWAPVNDPVARNRLDASVRDKVVVCDLRGAGVSDFGIMLPRGFSRSNPWVDVYFDGSPLTLARWPNRGDEDLRIGNVVNGKSLFRYAGDRPHRWKLSRDVANDDLWVSGLWQYEWAANTVKVRALDPNRRLLDIDHEAVKSGFPFYFLNILEELDQPGEFYLDRAAGLLYVLPPSMPDDMIASDADVELSVMNGPFLLLTQCSGVILENLYFSGCRQDAIHLDACRGTYLKNCMLGQVGGTAVVVDGGVSCGLIDCTLYSMGGGGVRMVGGKRDTLEAARHMVHNCRIEDFARVDRCYAPALQTSGCGMVLTNNTISRSPHHAVRVEGNDQYIARNEIYDVVREFGDQGAIDIYCDPTYRGIVIERNYIHDVGGPSVGSGQAGVRLDDSISGVLIRNNVFRRCSTGNFGAIHINGGKDSACVGNVFLDCPKAFSFTPWQRHQFDAFTTDRYSAFIGNALYEKVYPFMATILDGNTSRNFVVGNQAVNCGQFQRDGDTNLFIGNHWRKTAVPGDSVLQASPLDDWVQQWCTWPLRDIGVQD